MNIPIKNFGQVLMSRPAGKEAFAFAKAYVFDSLSETENITLDFDGVKVMTPSWLDEFIQGIKNNYKNELLYKNTSNESVKATLEMLG